MTRPADLPSTQLGEKNAVATTHAHEYTKADSADRARHMKDEYRRLTMGVEDQTVRWVAPVPVGPARNEDVPLLPT